MKAGISPGPCLRSRWIINISSCKLHSLNDAHSAWDKIIPILIKSNRCKNLLGRSDEHLKSCQNQKPCLEERGTSEFVNTEVVNITPYCFVNYKTPVMKLCQKQAFQSNSLHCVSPCIDCIYCIIPVSIPEIPVG